jgi:glutamate-1-semialdehyde 2,1-aminomutase
VNRAVMRRVSLGSMSSLQTHEEVELAEILTQIHPWAENARFTRGGGESMAAAVRIARAHTGRDKVALCGYHGWHDWYLAANLGATDSNALEGHLLPGLDPAGVPSDLAGNTLTFHYNSLDELDAVLNAHSGDLGAIVMEPSRFVDPAPGFLEGVRERCDRFGIPLIFDEISIGWRLCPGGAHLKFGVNPDIAVFAKSLGNGFPIGAIIGTREVMEAAQGSFISSTFWTEGVGPAAALACVRKMMANDIPAHLNRIGGLAMDGWKHLGEKHGVLVKVGGRPEMAILSFDHPEAAAITTLMTAEMLKLGYLVGAAFNATFAHEQRHVEAYLESLDEVFEIIATAIAEGAVVERIGGPVKHNGFARLT